MHVPSLFELPKHEHITHAGWHLGDVNYVDSLHVCLSACISASRASGSSRLQPARLGAAVVCYIVAAAWACDLLASPTIDQLPSPARTLVPSLLSPLVSRPALLFFFPAHTKTDLCVCPSAIGRFPATHRSPAVNVYNRLQAYIHTPIKPR